MLDELLGGAGSLAEIAITLIHAQSLIQQHFTNVYTPKSHAICE